jgi:hypothetical protein
MRYFFILAFFLFPIFFGSSKAMALVCRVNIADSLKSEENIKNSDFIFEGRVLSDKFLGEEKDGKPHKFIAGFTKEPHRES